MRGWEGHVTLLCCASWKVSCRSSAPLLPHFNLVLFSCSWGGRETVRHALRVCDPQRPHSAQPTAQQVCHPGTPAEALEMEKKEDGEVQTDLSWYVISFDFVAVRGKWRTAVVSVLHHWACLLPLGPEFSYLSVKEETPYWLGSGEPKAEFLLLWTMTNIRSE